MRKNVYKIGGAVAAMALAVGVSGCQKSATGQVAAVVNGEEISLQEVNAELAQLKLPSGVDKNAIRAQALQRIVDRRIVAQQAKTAGLDRDPEYLLRRRQLDEMLLIQLFAKKTQDTLRIPDAAAVTRYIGDHQQAFVGRTIYDVNQIKFATPADRSVLKALEGTHTIAAVAGVLKAKGVPFQAVAAKIDSAQVPTAVLAQVRSLPPGEPFISVEPQGVVASVIVKSTAAPLPDSQSRPLAVQAMRNEQLGKLLEQRLKDAKASAKIEYQPGFGPPAAGTKTGMPLAGTAT